MQLHEECIPHPEWGGLEVAADGELHYVVVRMLFNHRLIVTRPGAAQAEYGWCFKTAPHAVAAVAAWEPETQDEPLFWHKRAGDAVRRAPHRDEEPDYNRLRCVHGSYIHDKKCDVDPFCQDFDLPDKEATDGQGQPHP